MKVLETLILTTVDVVLEKIFGDRGGQHEEPDHAIVFRADGFSGSDAWLNAMPGIWQARIVASKLLDGPYRGINLATTSLIVEVPRGAFRVLDYNARVTPTGRVHFPVS